VLDLEGQKVMEQEKVEKIRDVLLKDLSAT
jgi:hypothetical protein